MLALSTLWSSSSSDRLTEAFQRCSEVGFSALTVDNLDPDVDFGTAAVALRQARIDVGAVARISPRSLDSSTPATSSFSLSSPDPETRQKAIESVRRLVQGSVCLRAPAVVLTGGAMEIEGIHDLVRRIRRSRLLGREDDAPEETAERIREVSELVSGEQDSYLDRLCRSLFELTRSAPEIRFALLSGGRPYELPNRHQLELIFSEVGSSNLHYWHDPASCHVAERLGFDSHQSWLETHAPRSFGCYLHDYLDLELHLPPGAGEVDFQMVGYYLPKECLGSLWVSGIQNREAVLDGVSHLEKSGFSGLR